MSNQTIIETYKLAKDVYSKYGIDTDKVLESLQNLSISLHCWQADDVGGFETKASSIGGGIQVTGNYPGKANTVEEMRADLEKVLSLLPGNHKLNLHAIYGEFNGEMVDRDQIEVKHFQGWIDWAKRNNVGIDFNATCFSHPKAEDGFTLSSKDEEVRKFWIEHVKRCREISNEIGKQLGQPCIHNTWIPDGSKDMCVDRLGHRTLLKASLDEIFETEYDSKYMKDAVESKLFGIGSESMVVGSYDFYLGYAIKNNKLICLDNGHFHPTEQVGDKISSVLQFVDEILLHMTRGVRWDSDHVVTLNDESTLIAQEVVRAGALDKTNVGLDFFDASINRVGAYVTGCRAARKAFLLALLEPTDLIKAHEEKGENFERMFLLEQAKSLPWGAVWDYYCLQQQTALDSEIIDVVQDYEKSHLLHRGEVLV
ncbi:L-rhamnose isomerase [Flammeovirga yaeyamensis]|uniref:L-rhamnose isomerase n=1 Tax=Flammeovirga yaeyamensis TaxID=367791 RepID=A0AAX1NBH5_9BACT|nr:L-rhamnose isomerase [Flammeovirga yaeyamensis]MBB3697203.1 L-rhamnose isomerase [Flammeovirga yaeyamensis]NMF33864.1 L-rhamnose isomerase [Flammeovirga yaeyamensis]QWG04876.1 L-rhamnose isomerase [Flammeovirga yaeyamensis]